RFLSDGQDFVEPLVLIESEAAFDERRIPLECRIALRGTGRSRKRCFQRSLEAGRRRGVGRRLLDATRLRRRRAQDPVGSRVRRYLAAASANGRRRRLRRLRRLDVLWRRWRDGLACRERLSRRRELRERRYGLLERSTRLLERRCRLLERRCELRDQRLDVDRPRLGVDDLKLEGLDFV